MVHWERKGAGKEARQAMEKLYPNSGVEVRGLVAHFYDRIMDFGSLGFYRSFIRSAVEKMNIQPDDQILDLGCGTGRNSLLMHRHIGSQGRVTGMDISPIMEKQFRKNTDGVSGVEFMHQRVDVSFDLNRPVDKVLMSFVLHGFPHEVRLRTIDNIHRNLAPGGNLLILDYGEFSFAEMPAFPRLVFKAIECEYAFDYIERDWKRILQGYGFGGFEDHFWLKGYIRLLKATKQ